jgi:riboflavin synthase
VFTGIVEELGQVGQLQVLGDSARLTVAAERVTRGLGHGDSVAVNGVCLTVTDATDGSFTVDVMDVTLQRTGLGRLAPGAPVNLERAMPADGRFGGHVVQGHVDGTGEVLSRTPGERWELVRVSLPQDLARYVVDKGSITVDGVSLTVAERDATSFTVSLIPTTVALTTLGARAPGELVNLEVDVIAKYVESLLTASRTS